MRPPIEMEITDSEEEEEYVPLISPKQKSCKSKTIQRYPCYFCEDLLFLSERDVHKHNKHRHPEVSSKYSFKSRNCLFCKTSFKNALSLRGLISHVVERKCKGPKFSNKNSSKISPNKLKNCKSPAKKQVTFEFEQRQDSSLPAPSGSTNTTNSGTPKSTQEELLILEVHLQEAKQLCFETAKSKQIQAQYAQQDAVLTFFMNRNKKDKTANEPRSGVLPLKSCLTPSTIRAISTVQVPSAVQIPSTTQAPSTILAPLTPPSAQIPTAPLTPRKRIAHAAPPPVRAAASKACKLIRRQSIESSRTDSPNRVPLKPKKGVSRNIVRKPFVNPKPRCLSFVCRNMNPRTANYCKACRSKSSDHVNVNVNVNSQNKIRKSHLKKSGQKRPVLNENENRKFSDKKRRPIVLTLCRKNSMWTQKSPIR